MSLFAVEESRYGNEMSGGEPDLVCAHLFIGHGKKPRPTPSLRKKTSALINLPLQVTIPLCLTGRGAWGCPRGEKHRGDVIQGEKTQANDVDICAEVKNEAIKPLHKLPNAPAATRRSSKWGINKGRHRQAKGG